MTTPTSTTHGDPSASHAEHVHHSHRALYYNIFAVLMLLLVLTVGAAELKLGEMNLIAALGIAFIKAGLILMFFMHFRDSDTLTWMVGGATVCFFVVMILLTYNDYQSRMWLQMPGK